MKTCSRSLTYSRILKLRYDIKLLYIYLILWCIQFACFYIMSSYYYAISNRWIYLCSSLMIPWKLHIATNMQRQKNIYNEIWICACFYACASIWYIIMQCILYFGPCYVLFFFFICPTLYLVSNDRLVTVYFFSACFFSYYTDIHWILSN